MEDKSSSISVFGEVTKFLILPFLILALLLGWVTNGYPGISKQKMYAAPFFADARCSRDFEWCASNSNEIKASQRILVGDSEAMSMIDSFRSFGSMNGFTPAIRAKSGCSFMFESYKGEQGKICRSFVRNTFKYLSSVTSKEIYVYNRIGNFDVSEYLNFFNTIARRGNKIIIIGNPFPLKNGFSAYTNILKSAPIGTPRTFYRYNFDFTKLQTQIQIWKTLSTAKFRRIRFFPTYPLFCSSYPCTLKDKFGNWYYSDSTHLSRFGTDFLLVKLEQAGLI